jgi:hypothetical protein
VLTPFRVELQMEIFELLSWLSFLIAACLGFVSLLGAHSTPFPNLSKVGCGTASGLIVVGILSGLVVPMSTLQECGTHCKENILPIPEEGRLGRSYVKTAWMMYEACEKGSSNAVIRADKQAEDVAKAIAAGLEPPPENPLAQSKDAEKMRDPAYIAAMCEEQALETCKTACFDAATYTYKAPAEDQDVDQ